MKWILNILLVYVVYRLARAVMRRPPPDAPRARGRNLDPDRAVRARWSEVPDEEGERRD